MTRRTVHNVLLLVVLLLGVAGAWGWWYMAQGRYPLAGDLSHDFGSVPIVGRSAGFEHTYRLRNRTGRPVVIEAIRPGCGCTKAEASTMTVAPGATVDVGITLRLSHAGHKRTYVSLVIEGFGEQRLWVQAVGRKETALSVGSDLLRLTSSGPIPLLVTAEVQSSDDPPPPPTIETPDGVSASFVEWKLIMARDRGTKRAARRRGRFDVELTAASLPPDAVLSVALPGSEPVVVRLAHHVTPPVEDGSAP